MRAVTKAMVEVTLVFTLVIGTCKVLYSFRSVPFLSKTLPVWAAALFLYVPLFVLLRTKDRPDQWGITLKGFESSIKLFLVCALLFPPGFVLLFAFHRYVWLHVPVRISLPPDWPLLLAYHLLCVAFPEEVFYRGYMQSRLNRVFQRRLRLVSTPVGFGWLYTAFLFALGHFIISPRLGSLATFVPGLLFGWMRERTGSIVASTLFHALCNATVLLLG